MPPIRTPTIKPVKTERTHEENQERAYIAASRRSDRSLEARIESARRASEIHKKRTGRALRVTEQDVVNEEMYEEEDDDLPAQYRRLQSHLQTGSFEFNRRLQAYMTSQMGTRNALMEQTMNGPYSNAPFFTNQFGQAQQPTMMNPQMLHYSNQGYRQAPYPMSPQNFPGMHQRAASISSPHDFANFVPNYTATLTTPQLSNEEQHRRMSLPPQVPQASGGMRPPVSRSASGVSLSDAATGSPPNAAAGSAHGQQTPTGNGMSFPTTTGAMFDGSVGNTFAPFSTSLPAETQQLPSQPPTMENSYNPYWFAGNSQPFSYSYKPNSRGNSPTEKPASSMDQTLSLNPLDTNVSSHSPVSQGYVASATTDGANTPFSGTFSNYNFGGEGFFPDDMKSHNATSGRDSGVVTPSGGDWTNFLEPYEDAGVSQS